MAMKTVICPFCGTQVQVEEGQYAHCPACATELNTAPAEGGFAFAPQDVPAAPDLQFAPPPEPAPMQPQQMQMPQQTGAVPMQPQYRVQYSPAQLQAAEKKRKTWHIMNCGLMGFQTLLFAFGVLFAAMNRRFGIPMILTWVLTLPFFAIISAMKRPDEAYIEKKPMSRIAHGILFLLLSAAATSAVGGILFAILAGLVGFY